MSKEVLGYSVRTCAICGKKFECLPSLYVYKRRSKTKDKNKTSERMQYFCSWTCYRVDEKKNEKKGA